MTTWKVDKPVEEAVPDFPGINLQNKRRRSQRRAWRDGLADQTVVKSLEDARSYRAFERTLIGSVDPLSIIDLVLVHRLANLLWLLCTTSAIEARMFAKSGGLPPA